MSAYGIAGLVDGFFKGREIRHGWEDRKEQKKRQAILDGYTAAEQARIAERHGWARDQYGRLVADYERARADDQAWRDANQAAIDATEQSLGAVRPTDEVAASTKSQQTPAPDQITNAESMLPAAIDAVTRRSAAADQFARFFDPNDLGAAPRVADGVPAGPRRADPTPEAATQTPAPAPKTIEDVRAQAIAEARAGRQMPAGQTNSAGTQAVPAMNMPDNPQLLTQGPGPGGGMQDLYDRGILPRRYIGDPPARNEQPAPSDPRRDAIMEQFRSDLAKTVAQGQPDYEHDWGKKGLAADAREAVNRASAVLGAIPQSASNLVRDAADTATVINNGLNRAVNPVVKYVTGGADGFEFPMAPIRGRAPSQAPDRAAAPQAADAPPARVGNPAPPTGAPASQAPPALGAGPRVSNVPPGAPEQTKQLAAVADEAMQAASTPAVESTAAAVAQDGPGLGAAGNRPYSEKQRERASASFIERYMEVGAPIVIKEYLRRGEIDKAQKFQEFLERNETKAGIKNWARATFAASVGDFDSFASEIMEGYNRLDYFGDDTTIVTSESGFTDADGNITKDNSRISGAKIVFKDERTGKTFEQTYDSPEDIVTMGVTLLAPEEAFEYWMRKTEEARDAALGAAGKANESEAATAKEIRSLTDSIVEGSKDISGVPTITRAEARRQAKAEIYAGTGNIEESDPLAADGATPAGLPILRRP